MKVVYISGKYRANSEWGLIENIRHAEDVARRLWGNGWAVICPHKNTAHFGGLARDPEEDHQLWLNGDLEILSRCDVVYMLKGWENSQGATIERQLALALGLEVYYE